MPRMGIRAATASDYPVFERLFPELQTNEDTPGVRVWSEEIAPQTLLVEEDGDVAGYIYFQILDGLGYVRHVVVDPGHRGSGVGRVLMQEVAARLHAAGIEQWCLNVKPDNVPAIRLYERMGMALQYACVAMRMGWDIVGRLPDSGRELEVAPLQAHDDAPTEAALGLPKGLLAKQRGMSGARLLLARQAEAIVGAAVFRPEFPGAYPFRARTPAVARAIVDAMRPHADLSKGYVQLVFEDAPQLEAAFDAAGATRHMEFVHFRGDVPR